MISSFALLSHTGGTGATTKFRLLYSNEGAIILVKGGVGMEQKQCPVDVISMCSASGEIHPLRLRMEDEAHQLLRIDIEEVVSCKEIQFVGIEAKIFLCQAPVKG